MSRRTTQRRSGLLRPMRPPFGCRVLYLVDACGRVRQHHFGEGTTAGRRWPFNGCWCSSASAVLAMASCQSRRDLAMSGWLS